MSAFRSTIGAANPLVRSPLKFQRFSFQRFAAPSALPVAGAKVGQNAAFGSFRVEIYPGISLNRRLVGIPTFTSAANSRPRKGSAGGMSRANDGETRVEMSWRLVKADGRPGDIVAFEEAVISFFMESAMLLGIPKSVAAIYGICFASPEPLSFSEINERLDISSGSISQGLRVLREVGALKVAQVGRTVELSNGGSAAASAERTVEQSNSGSAQSLDRNTVKQVLARSRDRYEPDLELRKLVLHWIEKRLQKQLTSGKNRLELIANAIPSRSKASTQVLQDRLGALQAWHGKAHSLLPVAKSFLKLT